jgi:hypothetical protein
VGNGRGERAQVGERGGGTGKTGHPSPKEHPNQPETLTPNQPTHPQPKPPPTHPKTNPNAPHPPPTPPKVGNFRVEPPGLFRGRGEHPKMGKVKKRVYPRDITINIGGGGVLGGEPFRHDHQHRWGGCFGGRKGPVWGEGSCGWGWVVGVGDVPLDVTINIGGGGLGVLLLGGGPSRRHHQHRAVFWGGAFLGEGPLCVCLEAAPFSHCRWGGG